MMTAPTTDVKETRQTTQTPRDSEAMFASIAKMVAKLAHKFCDKYRGEFEEWLSEANLSAVRAINSFDPTRAKLSTWVYTIVYYDLLTIVGQRTKAHQRKPEAFCERSYAHRDAVSWLDQFLVEISADARLLVECFTHADYCVHSRSIRKNVRETLRSQGWSQSKYERALAELQKELGAT